MEKALQLAIKAGWKPTGNEFEGEIPVVVTEQWIKSFCLLDPKFFQALGKAEGWSERMWGDGEVPKHMMKWLKEREKKLVSHI